MVEPESKSDEPPKSRGRAARNKSPEKEPESEPTTSKKAQKTVEEETKKPDEADKKKGRSGRKKAAEEHEVEEIVHPPSPKARGRGRKPAEEKPIEEKPVVKKRGRAATKAKEEEEEVIEVSSQDVETPKKRAKTTAKHVTIVTPSNTALLKKSKASGSEEAPAKSNLRKRNAQPELPTVSEEPAAKRPTRGKKK